MLAPGSCGSACVNTCDGGGAEAEGDLDDRHGEAVARVYIVCIDKAIVDECMSMGMPTCVGLSNATMSVSGACTARGVV